MRTGASKRIAVVSMRDSWGRARYNPLIEAFQKKGMKPVADEELSPDANDATAQVLRLKLTNADFCRAARTEASRAAPCGSVSVETCTLPAPTSATTAATTSTGLPKRRQSFPS